MKRNLIKKGICQKLIFITITWIFLTSTLTGLGTSSPVHYWSMDNYFGQTIGNPTLETNDCVQGKCMSFDGSSCITEGSGLNSPIENLATYTMWVKTGSDIDSLQYIFTQNGANTAPNNGVGKRGLYIQHGWLSAFVDTKLSGIQTITNYNSLYTNTWYFVSLVQNLSELNMYINFNGNTNGYASGSTSNFGDSWNFGCAPNQNNNFFMGKLDEINVFSSAFTASQVDQLYTKFNDPNIQSTQNTPLTTSTSSINLNVKLIIDFILVLLIITIPIYTIFSTKRVDTIGLRQRINLNNSKLSKSISDYSKSISDYLKSSYNHLKANYNRSNSPNIHNEPVNQNSESTKVKTKFCFSCGTNIDIDEFFCPNCGTRQMK